MIAFFVLQSIDREKTSDGGEVAKKFRKVTTTWYRVTESPVGGVKRRDVEFEWRIKMRCLDENKEISEHEGTDGGHLNCNFQQRGPLYEGSRVRNVCASQDVERSTFTRQQYCVTSLWQYVAAIVASRAGSKG